MAATVANSRITPLALMRGSIEALGVPYLVCARRACLRGLFCRGGELVDGVPACIDDMDEPMSQVILGIYAAAYALLHGAEPPPALGDPDADGEETLARERFELAAAVLFALLSRDDPARPAMLAACRAHGLLPAHRATSAQGDSQATRQG